jgi:hypothetical protein
VVVVKGYPEDETGAPPKQEPLPPITDMEE